MGLSDVGEGGEGEAMNKPQVWLNLTDMETEDNDELYAEAVVRRNVYIAVMRAMVRGVQSTKGLE